MESDWSSDVCSSDLFIRRCVCPKDESAHALVFVDFHSPFRHRAKERIPDFCGRSEEPGVWKVTGVQTCALPICSSGDVSVPRMNRRMRSSSLTSILRFVTVQKSAYPIFAADRKSLAYGK